MILGAVFEGMMAFGGGSFREPFPGLDLLMGGLSGGRAGPVSLQCLKGASAGKADCGAPSSSCQEC
jgi:hypothetical protein